MKSLKGTVDASLGHQTHPYLYLNSMKGTTGIHSDAPAILAGNSLVGSVDLSFHDSTQPSTFSDDNVEVVVIVEGLERGFSSTRQGNLEFYGVSKPGSYPSSNGKIDVPLETPETSNYALIWRKQQTFAIDHANMSRLRFSIDLPGDSPESYLCYSISPNDGKLRLHGDIGYYLQVAVFHNGKLCFQSSQPKKFLIMNQPLPSDPSPVYHPPERLPIMRWKEIGSLLVAYRLDSQNAAIGNNFVLRLQCATTTAVVQSMTVRLIEKVVTAGAEDGSRLFQKTSLSTITDIPVELVDEDELHDINEVTSAPIILAIQNRKTRCSRRGQFLNVLHYIQVTFVLSGMMMIRPVKMKIPVRVGSPENVRHVEPDLTDSESDDDDP